MNQAQYEAKKALLKRIKHEWAARMQASRQLPKTRASMLLWGDAMAGYRETQDKLNRFIRRSIAFNELRP